MRIKAVLINRYKDIKGKILDNEETAKSKTLDKIIKDTEPYVPCNTGYLSDSVAKDVPSSSIAYHAPYASYAFEPIAPSGKPKEYDTSKHPQAQGYPIQAAYGEHGDEWNKLFLEELLRGVE